MKNDKTIWNLMVDLLSFSDLTIPVVISIDGGNSAKRLKLIIGDFLLDGDYSIKDIIEYFRLNYKDPNLNVKILDESRSYTIDIVGKKNGRCVLIHHP